MYYLKAQYTIKPVKVSKNLPTKYVRFSKKKENYGLAVKSSGKPIVGRFSLIWASVLLSVGG
jgi:hypothetical protein